MSTRTNLITGIAIGSGMMFLLDPQLGNRRRARMRDRAVRWSRTTGRALRRTGHVVGVGYQQAAAGSRGAVEAVRRFREGTEPMPDHLLAARLRSCIGRHSSHPRAIDVEVHDGCATLTGSILAAEVREVLECASAIHGVMAVDNRLQVHADAAGVPALQGEGHRRSVRRWWEKSPAFRMTTGAALAGVIAFFAGRRVVS